MSKPVFVPGQQVEEYILEKQIGRGGTTELYTARDVGLKKRVVIKVLRESYKRHKRFQRQFLKEAKIQANLDNPHIVQVLRMFTYRDLTCLVMQYVRGTDLEKIVKKAEIERSEKGERGALSVERAGHIFAQMLEGVGFIHRYRIIHGDLKPSNILLDRQGRVRVTDFGLSFLLPMDGKETQQLLPGGTPYYMPPEQFLTDASDFRSDIYSLGVTLFRMLTGDIPSGKRKNLTELLEYHLEGSLERPMKVLESHSEIPAKTRSAILKALENDPEKRHQSCLEFLLAIKEDMRNELYSELLRLSFLCKEEISKTERDYLDRLARQRGLSRSEAAVLEEGIRKELRLVS